MSVSTYGRFCPESAPSLTSFASSSLSVNERWSFIEGDIYVSVRGRAETWNEGRV